MNAVRKAALYRTAVIARDIFTHNGEDDLQAGTIVGVRYRCTAWNAMYRRGEDVYTVTLQGGRVYGDMYENCLREFVL